MEKQQLCSTCRMEIRGGRQADASRLLWLKLGESRADERASHGAIHARALPVSAAAPREGQRRMSIDVRHINAFLEATQAVFSSMVKLPVTFEKPELGTRDNQYDVSGVIGLSGDVLGSVIVGFTKLSAVQIASAFAQTRLEIGTPDFADAIGELANMIAGGAKAKFEGQSVSIGCPSVIIAPGHKVTSPSSAKSICIHCNTAAGRFTIDVAIQSSTKAQASPAAAASGRTSTAVPASRAA